MSAHENATPNRLERVFYKYANVFWNKLKNMWYNIPIRGGHKMYSAVDIANYLIFVTSDICSDMSNMKVNKLVYFAQGHALKRGFSLFDEKIRAGQHGPMVEEVYHAYEQWGDEPILKWDEESAKKLPSEIREFLIEVAGKYVTYTAAQLRQMTHQTDSPWDKCFVQGGRYRQIPNEIIAEYFKNEDFSTNADPQPKYDFVGHRDDEGYIVLPKDMQ